ncbi:HAD hydrolase family protein [Acidobacteriota bacterium]
MIEIDVPGGEPLSLEFLAIDFSGTLAFDGKLIPGIRDKLTALSEKLEIHVLTSDTFGTASSQLDGLPLNIMTLEGADHTGQKARYVEELGADRVVAIGNGMNDIKMLKAARLGIVVLGGEGGAAAAFVAADIVARNIGDALGILLTPLCCKATLRR